MGQNNGWGACQGLSISAGWNWHSKVDGISPGVGQSGLADLTGSQCDPPTLCGYSIAINGCSAILSRYVSCRRTGHFVWCNLQDRISALMRKVEVDSFRLSFDVTDPGRLGYPVPFHRPPRVFHGGRPSDQSNTTTNERAFPVLPALSGEWSARSCRF